MQPDLENIKNKVESNTSYIDKISAKLPGFKGYKEKSDIYSVDKIMRNFISEKIQDYKLQVNSISSELFNAQKTDLLPKIDALNNVIERVLKKTQFADFGNTASLSGVAITDEDKNRLLEFDWRLIATIEESQSLLDNLKNTDSVTADTIKEFETNIKSFEEAFDDRKNILTEVI